MKISKMILAGLVGFGLIAQAKADVTVYVTGSTAFRNAAYFGIRAMFNPGFTEVTYGNAAPNKGNEMMWIGTVPAAVVGGANIIAIPGTVTIKAHWSGSVEGVRDVTGGNTIAFFPNSSKPAGNYSSINFANSSTYVASDFESTAHAADIAMVDNFQSSTKYTTPVLVDKSVGVITFVWTKNAGAPAALINMTHALARSLLAGPIPLSLFTGNPADFNGTAPYVYAAGRYDGSGTRVQAFADCGYGIFSTPQQFAIGAGPALTLFSGPDANGVATSDGSQGYASGGGLAGALNIAGSSTAADPFNGGTGWYAIGYLGTSDNNSVNGGNNALTLNGVAYSAQAVAEGQYTFWGYEHEMYLSTLSGDKLTAAKNLFTEIVPGGFATQAGVALSAMHVTKATDLADAAHN
jgi:hypothetical protein